MRGFFDERQLHHAPTRELHNGEWTPYAETPSRAETIRALPLDWHDARDFGSDPLAAVHTPAYLAFLAGAHDAWLAAGRTGDAIGYTFPIVRRRPLSLGRIDAALGAHSFDASTPVAAGTWSGAYWAAQTALTALDWLATGPDTSAFALCRPPGHHAGADYMGGYCYLNNAAIAARAAQARNLGPVAILDIDYHHGNGTQDIFAADPDVFFASVHADPATDYPFYWGHADERGEGAGLGTTLNLPLPRGTGITAFAAAVETALAATTAWGARCLILSFGADTFAGDPISCFTLQQPDYDRLGRLIAGTGLPVLVVMEGGYAVDALAGNVAALLRGIDPG